MEKIAGTLEKYCERELNDLKSLVAENETKNGKWRANQEKVESRKFDEVHTAVKVLN